MKKGKNRGLSLVLAVSVLLGSVLLPAHAANPAGVTYLNTHVNTGNQRHDILSIALTQMGYTEGERNDTKFGDWGSFPRQPWCANFVSWCARQADISTDIIQKSARANPTYFQLDYYDGAAYMPQPGDLFFTKGFTHVGLVWYVEDEFFYSVEGNAKFHDYNVPDDPEEESYFVMSNKRRISEYYFSAPAYEGGDQTHHYVKGQESSHPHKTYYQCTTCDEKYYTGYTACVAGCKKCFSCGCSSSKAGYYLTANASGPIKIRTSHNSDAAFLGYVSVGEAVYVHGISGSGTWAYITYDGLRGHIPARYLTAYQDVPAAPQASCDQEVYHRTEPVTISWSESENTEQYRLKIYRDGTLYEERSMDMETACSLTDLPYGAYRVQVLACNRAGAAASGAVEFTIRNTYKVSYDARGGSGAPQEEIRLIGEPVSVSEAIPVREGYTFLGWTEEAQGNVAAYAPGVELEGLDNITLYAVWTENSATPQDLTITQLPSRSVYLCDEALDTTGFVLQLTYADGAGILVTDGYTTEGFDSKTYGEKPVTVIYGDLSCTFRVQVAPYIPGDTDGNKTVDRDDVMQLLWHISFPDTVPVEGHVDYTDDGNVDRDDVIQLLWHVTFPEQFPLEVVWPEETPADEMQHITEGEEV